MTIPVNVKLGKLAPKLDSRTLQLADYLAAGKLPPVPPSIDWGTKINQWGEMLNSQIGDCTCAAAGHMIEAWTSESGTEVVVPDSAILTAYSAVSGYDPTTGANDNGATCLDVLNYWRKTGIDGHTIMAYVALIPGHEQHVQAACYLFGGCYLGLALPLSVQSQDVWDVPAEGLTGDGAPGSWGGHACPVVAYDAEMLTVVTWGQLQQMTWNFFRSYTDECYAVLSNDFLNASHVAANGFNLVQLENDLKKVTH